MRGGCRVVVYKRGLGRAADFEQEAAQQETGRQRVNGRSGDADGNESMRMVKLGGARLAELLRWSVGSC